ncbi:RNA polymerase sigma-70 factor [Mariniphaga sediminis]|jgi:RNA polymerase sigma-70 factor (ECF subfamily)|uniref:RNA polymerase sigma-70 factor n=1 Tax=Mariniphaga sediminis TaxID=1628158 RepID=A0A399D4R9_9BACT|nr:RNA polymerase sigma-70 factor [Mariniphaga sediminis]RIH66904.1 RNA polymerase sigma-70 factor [Mariniphaga sediminis]
MDNLTEKALYKALKSGQPEAFNALYYKYHKKLFAFIYKFLKNWHDTEDLVQKVFVIIWEKKENIDLNKSFNNYIFIIARNEVYDFLKKKALMDYCDDYALSNIKQTEEGIETKRIVETIYSLIKKLPERRRQIFLLNRDHGLTYKQIAVRLNISENTVDTQIRNALNFLRGELPRYLKVMVLFLIDTII